MRDFFHSWRRKAGCVALVAATMLTMLWFRSAGIVDDVCLPTGGNTYQLLLSRFGEFTWQWNDAKEEVDFHWQSIDLEPPSEMWSRRFDFEAWSLTLPYWSVTLAMTMLSAYLILWKPRKRARLVNSDQQNF